MLTSHKCTRFDWLMPGPVKREYLYSSSDEVLDEEDELEEDPPDDDASIASLPSRLLKHCIKVVLPDCRGPMKINVDSWNVAPPKLSSFFVSAPPLPLDPSAAAAAVALCTEIGFEMQQAFFENVRVPHVRKDGPAYLRLNQLRPDVHDTFIRGRRRNRTFPPQHMPDATFFRICDQCLAPFHFVTLLGHRRHLSGLSAR